MTWILAPCDHAINGLLVNGKSVLVELLCRVRVALAVKQAVVAVRIVGQEVLLQSLERVFLENNAACSFKELTVSLVELFLVASKVPIWGQF